jgi:zinc transporter
VFSHIEDETYELEGLLDKIEAEIDTISINEAQKIVVDIRQQVISFRRYLMPQRDAILRLPSEKLKWLPQKQSMEFKDYGDNMSRYVEDLYAARERAGVLQDKLYNRLSDRLNTKMYVLSIIALIFLPAGFITGLFGMNIIIPGANNVDTFWVVVSLIASMTIGMYFYCRRKEWL